MSEGVPVMSGREGFKPLKNMLGRIGIELSRHSGGAACSTGRCAGQKALRKQERPTLEEWAIGFQFSRG